MSTLKVIQPRDTLQGHPNPSTVSEKEARELEHELHRRLQGEVRFDVGTRAIYAVDGSNYRQVPIGAVIPRSIDDVVQTIAVCRELGAPVLSRGGGTSLAGQ